MRTPKRDGSRGRRTPANLRGRASRKEAIIPWTLVKETAQMKQKVAMAEGDVNNSDNRLAWAREHISGESARLLERDSQVFLHQCVSTPCLNTIGRAEGIWIEDLSGKRFMDFHGNNVHHIGYGHPRLVQAVQQQDGPLALRPATIYVRCRCGTGRESSRHLAPGALSKLLFTTGGSDAIEVALAYARAATGRHKTISFWDAYHGSGFGARSISGEEMFRSGPHRTAPSRHAASAPLW